MQMIGMSGRSIMRRLVVPLAVLLSLAMAACGGASHAARPKASTVAANSDWPSFGNSQSNTRYSALSQVNTSNVAELGIAWARAQLPGVLGPGTSESPSATAPVGLSDRT